MCGLLAHIQASTGVWAFISYPCINATMPECGDGGNNQGPRTSGLAKRIQCTSTCSSQFPG